MAVDKEKLASLLQVFGFKLNASAIEDEEEYQEPEAAMDDEPEEEETKKPMRKNEAQPAAPASRSDQPGPDFQNLLKLNTLIDEIGGFDAYKGLLLNAVEAVEFMQQNQGQERDLLVTGIVQNSAGAFEKADLEDMDIPTLRRLSKAFDVEQVPAVDYRALGAGSLKVNQDDIAPMPDIFAIVQNNKEA